MEYFRINRVNNILESDSSNLACQQQIRGNSFEKKKERKVGNGFYISHARREGVDFETESSETMKAAELLSADNARALLDSVEAFLFDCDGE